MIDRAGKAEAGRYRIPDNQCITSNAELEVLFSF